MPKVRKSNYVKLYQTYKKRRDYLFYLKDKELESQLSLSEFTVQYEQMKQAYIDAGYKSPTKNIIQNMTNNEIAYDFSLKQARGIKQYLKEIDPTQNIKIRDIRWAHRTGVVNRDLIKDINNYLKDSGYAKSSDRATKIREMFFWGDSK